MVDCTGLENRQRATVREFESHRLRQRKQRRHFVDAQEKRAVKARSCFDSHGFTPTTEVLRWLERSLRPDSRHWKWKWKRVTPFLA